MEPVVEQQLSHEHTTAEVPIAYTLMHLGIDHTAIYPKVTSKTIAKTLGIDRHQVNRPLKKYGIEPEDIRDEQQQTSESYYPFYATELVREERAWYEWYMKLPKQLTTNQVAESVGRSYTWTKKTIVTLYPNAPQEIDGHKSHLYPRISVEKLRAITFETAPDEDWYTIPKLIELTGQTREWILNCIAKTTIQAEQRIQILSGRVLAHYPPDTLEVLQLAIVEIPRPAGNWLTAYAMEAILQKSQTWIQKRLEDSFMQFGEPRLTDIGVIRIHYPPWVVTALQEEATELTTYKQAEDWATFSSMYRQFGMRAVTLATTMQNPDIEIEAEVRLDKVGRPKLHFSPETQHRLGQEALKRRSYPEAGDWIPFRKAQTIIKRPAPWIREQFTLRNSRPETRLDAKGFATNHFDPIIVHEIKEYGDSLDAGSMVCIEDIVGIIKRPRSWVVATLHIININPIERFTRTNKLTGHYPDSIIETLLQA